MSISGVELKPISHVQFGLFSKEQIVHFFILKKKKGKKK
jgi:hypothetical protein